MGPTIKDVAKKAGVSVSTVSLVINRKQNVSEETVNKVHQAIADLNYHPRHSARGLASKKSGNIGFILTEDHFSRAEPFYTKVFLGSEFEARQHNYYILLTTVDNKFNKNSIPRFLLERNVDGVILAGKIPNGWINNILQCELKVIFVDYLPPTGKFPAILIDNVDGAIQAVCHLIHKGHRQIAFVGGDISHPSIMERFQGYKQCLKQADIPIQENLVVTDELYTGDADGYHAMCKLMSREVQFTAIFAANDAMAFGCMRCLREKNIKVPDNVAVVGFDDVDVAIQIQPHLTTVRVDKEEMGSIAVRTMVDMLSNEKKTFGKIVIPVELVIRQSC